LQAAETEPSPELLKDLDDETLLSLYQEIVKSQLTADVIREKIAKMSPEEQDVIIRIIRRCFA
jgi:predicted transcriptional regulator